MSNIDMDKTCTCLVFTVILCFATAVDVLPTTVHPTTTPPATTPPATTPPTTAPKETTPLSTDAPTTVTTEERCGRLNTSCEACIGDVDCYYCKTNGKCRPYPYKHILPSSDECPLDEARWGVCWLNYQALIISMGVIGGVLLFSLCCGVYCCCCRSKKSSFGDTESRIERKREELKLKHSERQADRRAKNDEIRRKYGLIKDDNPYRKFD